MGKMCVCVCVRGHVLLPPSHSHASGVDPQLSFILIMRVTELGVGGGGGAPQGGGGGSPYHSGMRRGEGGLGGLHPWRGEKMRN